MLKKNIKNQKGLTLIELLAVIVILGIIAAIAVPAIGNVINNTKEKAAYADAQQIIESARLYITAENPEFNANNKLALDQSSEKFKAYYDKAGNFSLTATRDASSGKLTFAFTSIDDITIAEGDTLTEAEIAEKLD
ncbi:prepilin-type N-terminal cleavage/methylation domain-containing protein [Bacillus sp. JJ1533]|uniref:type II secretion system protein n=1 Tax=Bacillus sp. JJ1533 TaxID=3122959 RepID=UPI002FFE6285